MTFSEDILENQNSYFGSIYNEKEADLNSLKSHIKAINRDLRNYETSAKKTKLELYDIKNILEQNDKTKNERIALIKKNTKSLKKLFFVDKVFIRGNKLSILTKTLILKGYDFGRFLISINSNYNYPYIFRAKSYKNYLKRRLSPFSRNTRWVIYHPHISSKGDVCLGDFTNLVEKLMRNFDFESVFTTIWEILTTYNPDDSYEPIESIVELYNIERYDPETNKTV